ncbi:MAG: hypothetical protein NZM25_03300 [Leptospiraceae bacterium]|nr:hypothetical protein [Leptospiraceae bacterium]MDW8306013.1 hypothetical protein [Leptospiraceae bacterium]
MNIFYSLWGLLFFMPLASYLWYYIFGFNMHFPLLYLAAILPTIASLWALASLLVQIKPKKLVPLFSDQEKSHDGPQNFND